MANLAIAKEQGAQGTLSPRQVAEAWFASLEQGNLRDAQAMRTLCGKHPIHAGRQRLGAMAGNLPRCAGSHEEHRGGRRYSGSQP